MKKLTSILLALLMALTLLPTAVFADDAVAQVGDKTFTTLADAVYAVTWDTNGANGNKEIKLLKSTTGAGIITYGSPSFGLSKATDFTIDFCGFTYTVDSLVGSSGTKNQAVHIEKGDGNAKVTFKNGTLNVADSVKSNAKFLIQNYCNLTAVDMKFDGTNLQHSTQDSYVLSNNDGVVSFTNCVVTAPTRTDGKGSYALDAAIWGAYAGAAVSVENCTIYGKMEIAKWERIGGTWTKTAPVAVNPDTGRPCLTVKNCTVTDLASAMLCAADGTIIKLASDVTLTEMVTLNKNLTINLNGHKLSRDDGNDIVQVIDNKTLTINGTTANSTVYGRINVGIAENNNGNVILDGGMYSCGTGKNNAGQTVLHINGTCHDSDVTIKNATITSPNDNAIQLNGGGTFLIENSTITGATAVYIKSGNLTVKGSTLTGNKSPVDYEYNGNGANATGDGMVIDSCDYPAGAPTVTIENTKVTGTKAAVGTYEILKADKSASHTTATVSLTSGSFTSGEDHPSVSTKVSSDGITASNITITGGTFSADPTTFVDTKTYDVTKTSNTYTVGMKLADYTAVNAALEKAAKYNEADYTTDSYAKLTAAVKAANDAVKAEKLPITEQAKVDKLATDIETAIKGLEDRVKTETINKNETSSTVNESTTTTTTSGTGANATTTVTHTIDATTSNGNKTTTATVNVPMVVVATMAESANGTNNVTVVIKTDVGTITLDKAALKAITANLAGVDGAPSLRMTVKDTTDDDNANHTKRYEVTIEAVDEDGNTTSVYSSSNSKGSATVTVEYTQQNANKRVYVYYVENGVTKERMNATYVDGKLTWTTTHFSTFEVREAYPPRIIHHGGAASSTTTTDKSTSPTTFDAGIAIYGVMAVSSVLGMGYMGKKKFF